MLVLSRRVGDSLVIGEDIEITVLDIRGDVARIGVAAPREVAVRRKELLAELAEGNRSAAAPSPAAISDLAHVLSARRKPNTPTESSVAGAVVGPGHPVEEGETDGEDDESAAR
jgi:carbon storage regulator